MKKRLSLLLVLLSACTSKPDTSVSNEEATLAGKVSVIVTDSTTLGISTGDRFTGLTPSALSTGKYSLLRGTRIPASTPSPTPTSTPTPTPSPTSTPTPTPTPSNVVPDLALWESHMVIKGQLVWDQLKGYIKSWQEGGKIDSALAATYYDAPRVFHQIAEYTGDPKWLQAEADAELVYKYYITTNNGNVPGYWNFSEGFLIDFKKTGDTTSRDALFSLKNASFCPGWTPVDYTVTTNSSREVAYCLNAYNNIVNGGGTIDVARRDVLANQILSAGGHVDQWVNETSRVAAVYPESPSCASKYYLQPFMTFLTMEALIRHFDLTGDVRVQPAVQRLADYVWSKAWVPANNSFWYENCYTPGVDPGFPAKAGTADLNLLGAVSYGWLYAKTGNVKYRDQGDLIWSGGVRGAYLDQGKQFDQNYAFSFAYLKYRAMR